MVKLAILADDFTGALDTGVQFAKVGITTLVTTTFPPILQEAAMKSEVLVLDLETRHLTAGEAGKRVAVCMALLKSAGIEYFYKKTDSAMRGNIGAELEAMCDGETLFFAPAFPKAGRTTIGGRHYCDGVPISKSVFGKDPFNPVAYDFIADIIATHSQMEVVTVSQTDLSFLAKPHNGGRILVFDAASDEEMRRVAEKLKGLGAPRLMAGCAGMAEYLPEMIGLEKKNVDRVSFSQNGLTVVSGSLNEMTLEQVEYAQAHDFSVLELTPEQKLCADITKSGLYEQLAEKVKAMRGSGIRLILQASSGTENLRRTDELARGMNLSAGDTRERVASNMGRLAAMLLENGWSGTLAVFGGDTLISAMRAIGCDGIRPVCEVESGVVLSSLPLNGADISLITKSGGFGNKDIIVRIEQFINDCFEEYKEGEGTVYA